MTRVCRGCGASFVPTAARLKNYDYICNACDAGRKREKLAEWRKTNPPKALPPLRERLLAKIHITDGGCWAWTGRKTKGYGRIWVSKSLRQTHRLSYETFRGPIPPGLFVCHHCDNPPCINPDHLFLGTHADNQRDKVAKGRQAKGKSVAHRKAAFSHHTEGEP